MALLTLPQPTVFSRLFARLPHLSWRLAGFGLAAGYPEISAEEDRARRDFVQDMMARCPGAFSSDLDVQTVMLHFPDRF